MTLRRSLLIAAGLLVASATVAHAQDANVIDTIVARFQTVANGWQGRLQGIAQNTFAILALLQLAWAMIGLVFKRADFSEFLAELVKQIMFIGLFYWLLTTTTTWGPAIIASFRQAGGTVSGTATLTPGDVAHVGLNIAGQIWAQTTIINPGASAGLAIAALVVLACFAWIVLTMVVVLVESYMVIAGGVLLMAFGGSSWTKDVAIGVIRTVFGVGAKLFGLQLIASVGSAFIQQWSTGFNAVDAQGVMLEIFQALVLAGITKTIPDLFQRMVGGIGTANGGALIGAAAGLASATVMMASATAKLATTVAGMGAVTGAGAALASGQMAARVANGTAPTTAAGRAAAMVGGTIGNVGSAVATDVGRRLSGQGTRLGYAGFRQASDLNERSRLLNEKPND